MEAFTGFAVGFCLGILVVALGFDGIGRAMSRRELQENFSALNAKLDRRKPE